MVRVSTATSILAAGLLSFPLATPAQQADAAAQPSPAAPSDDADTGSAALRSELEAARAELEALRQQLAAPDADVSTDQSTDEPSPETADLPPPAEAATGAPRDAALVAATVATAPGAPTDPARLDRLRDLLVQGVCAPDALAQVQDPINRQTLLALMTQLPRC